MFFLSIRPYFPIPNKENAESSLIISLLKLEKVALSKLPIPFLAPQLPPR